MDNGGWSQGLSHSVLFLPEPPTLTSPRVFLPGLSAPDLCLKVKKAAGAYEAIFLEVTQTHIGKVPAVHHFSR